EFSGASAIKDKLTTLSKDFEKWRTGLDGLKTSSGMDEAKEALENALKANNDEPPTNPPESKDAESGKLSTVLIVVIIVIAVILIGVIVCSFIYMKRNTLAASNAKEPPK